MEKLAFKINGTPMAVPNGVPTEGTSSINSVLQIGFTVLIVIAIIASLFYLIWGGLDWIISEGDKQKVAQAKTKIWFAIIGLIVIFLAFFIINTVTQFFLGGPSVPCGLPRTGQPSIPC